ncbi:MAG: stage II sporulation protein M [Candidatus Desulforudis sp.]|nr:stage II sporulation protein M [Desulforudis sp.]
MARVFRQFMVLSVRSHWNLYLVVGFFFLAGVAAGGWSAGGLETTKVGELQEYIDHLFINADLERNAGEQFVQVTYNNVMLIAAIYLAGLSVIGIPVMLGLLFVRGFAMGFAVWFVISEMGWPGVLLVLASILPQNLILIPAAIFAGAAALSFSVLLVRRGFNPEINVWANFLRYSGMLAAAAAVAVGAGMVEAFVTPNILELLLEFPG